MTEKKEKILWISPYAPYDGVAHGGGQNHNYYVKYFHKTGRYDIMLLSLCRQSETGRLDLDSYGIRNRIGVMDPSGPARLVWRCVSGFSYRNPFDRFGGTCQAGERCRMNRLLVGYRSSGECPDIVILQWTFSLMFVEKIRRYFPESRIIAIEEDVTFLNYQRKMDKAEDAWDRFFWEHRYSIMKKSELEKLRKVSLIVTNNPKDTKLLTDNGISSEKIFTSAPYFKNYQNLERKQKGKDVLFFGTMSRPENYQSAIWFIDKVMPLISDKEVRFVIAGGEPAAQLCRYRNSRVIITGYVEDVSEYFEGCLCMAAPLVGGAGIKIKILEAMSAGIPVLTNEIGIEGIAAVDGKDYYFCSRPEEYAARIDQMAAGMCPEELSRNAKLFISEHYNLPEKLDALMDRI